MKNFLYLLCVLAICISPAAAQSFVTGVIPQYAGGIVTATTGSTINNASINSQGNFTIPVPSNPTTHVMTFTPPSNTPYSPFNLTVTAGVGTTNITAQIQAVVPQIGINLGISNASAVATDSNGNAIPGNGGGGGGAVSSVFGRTGTVAAQADDYTADQIGSGTVTGHGWVCGSGCVWTTSAGGFNNANEVNGSTLPVSAPILATNSSGGLIATSLATIGAAQALNPIYTFWGYGDSYMVGTGVPVPGQQSMFSLLAAQTPAPNANHGEGGATIDEINFNDVFPTYAPSLTTPSVVIFDSGANDGTHDTCGGTTTSNCAHSYSLSLSASLAWISIPQQFRILASNATQGGGTWFQGGQVPLYVNPYLVSPGIDLHIAQSGSTLTFAVPSSASPVIGVNQEIQTGNTGTYTVSIDGTLRIDLCSGTTTFISGPCGGISLPEASGTIYRQEYAVTPNITHTVIITTTNAASMGILDVDWIPPAANANTNVVFPMGPNASFTFSSTYETLSSAVAAQLHTDGLPIYYTSQISGTPGINSTTDISGTSTATCSASTAGNHPNTCGYANGALTYQNVAKTNNYVFSSFNANQLTVSSSFLNPITVAASPIGNAPRTATYSWWNPEVLNASAFQTGLGIDWIRSGNQLIGVGYGYDTTSGNPYSGQVINKSFGSVGWYCHQSVPVNNLTINAESSYTSKWCLDYTTGNSVQTGVASYNIGTAIASAATIAPVNGIFHITGTAAIATITPPADFTATTGGCLTLWPDAAWTWTSGGNLSNTGTAVPGTPLQACWGGTTFYIK